MRTRPAAMEIIRAKYNKCCVEVMKDGFFLTKQINGTCYKFQENRLTRIAWSVLHISF